MIVVESKHRGATEAQPVLPSLNVIGEKPPLRSAENAQATLRPPRRSFVESLVWVRPRRSAGCPTSRL